MATTNPTDSQLIRSLTIRMDVLELEVAMWKSEASREKNAWQYCQEAVAAEYGILPCEFRRRPSGPGRPKEDTLPAFRQAQYLLFCMLVHVVGVNINDVRSQYGNWVVHHTRWWGELYDLVHRPREMTKRNKHLWDLYAPRFQGAYNRMKQAMINDGVWSDYFDDELLPDLTI